MVSGERIRNFVYELYGALPRQGPGSTGSTRRALSRIPPLGAGSRVLDLGCGRGAQTFDLARYTAAEIVALDIHPPYVADLNARAAARGLAGRVRAEVGDMLRPAFPPASFDCIWSEGAIYNAGFERGLAAWRPLLKPGGHVAVTELCWLRSDPPAECAAFFADEYPDMRAVPECLAGVERAGYEVVGHFVLPRSVWEEFYAALEREIPAFTARHPGDRDALEVARISELEIAVFRRCAGSYGYVFFIMRRR